MLAVALLVPLAVAGVREQQSARLVGLFLGMCCIVPITWRRRAPMTVFVISGVSAFAAIASGHVLGVSPFGPMIALYSVAAWCDRRRSLGAAVVSLAGVLVAEVVSPRPSGFEARMLIGPAAVVAVTWLIGDNLRVRRAYVAQLEARAEHLEREQANEAQRAVDGERTRIARELHDVVAHHVSVIAVQAGAARMVAGQRPVPQGHGRTPSMSDDMLGSIEMTARQALGELRRLLGVLRKEDGQADLAPQPGLHQLAPLVAQLRDSGVPVELEIDEAIPDLLPSGVDLTAYRIIQEALTNVLKHAGGAATRVVVGLDGDDLVITVGDRGPGPAPTGADGVDEAAPRGHGLIGMGERVALFGGELRHGPGRFGGFEVVARIPLGGAETVISGVDLVSNARAPDAHRLPDTDRP
jgi:signal transduction histidine kinase